jgi:hypothetical protein
MKVKSTVFATAFGVVLLMVNACSKSSNAAGGPGSCSLNVSFSGNIKKILDTNCTLCHAPGSGNVAALFKWTYDGTYSSAQANSSNITAQVSAGIMPQTGPLPQAVRDSIACWVSKGTPN